MYQKSNHCQENRGKETEDTGQENQRAF
uniref:Uncharacterized protein n=1 Tax=Anguilla anguilla TaxID=7936 RepID=A0A0E9TT06_ANGAN